MNGRKYSFFVSVLTAASLAAGLCFCLVTSFQIPADARLLALGCAAAAALFSSLFLLKKSWIWLLGALLILTGGCWYLRTALYESAAALVYAVTAQYAQAFSAVQPVELLGGAQAFDATFVLTLLAVFWALVCAWTVMRGQSLLYLLTAALPPVVLCLVILQTPPAMWAILLVLGSLALLLLSQSLRTEQTAEGNRMALLLAGPLAALVVVLALLFPSGTYERADWSDALQTAVATAADKLTLFRRDVQTGQVKFVSPVSPSTLGSYLWDSSVTSVNLNRIGPMRQYGRSVMRVKSEVSGPTHLRGDSMAIYEDNRWKALDDEDYDGVTGAQDALTAGAAFVSYWPDMQIETDMKSGIYYTPYYPLNLPDDAEPYYDAYFKNPSQETSYTVSYTDLRGFLPSDAYEAFAHEVYTQVPDETRQALSDILPQLGVQAGDDPAWIAAAVRAYVQSSARYDLNTPSVPNGEDFVSWFLHDSDTGYCVHFATAATILLRCLDVPARYVTGYTASTTAGAWTTVTSDDAHAWVECYIDGEGWYVLDPTPAAEETSAAPEDTPGTQEPEKDPAAQQDPTQDPPQTPSDPEPVQNGDTVIDHVEKTDEAQPKKLGFLHFIWPPLVLLAALLVWRALLFSIRRAAIGKGSPNRRAVTLYHHICWLARQTKTEVPTEFLEIAEKARFSHHRLSKEDLLPLQTHAEQLTKQLLADKRFWKQVLYRVFYALG